MMENDLLQIPYIVYESAQARSERTSRRLTVALIIAIALIFVSNALWLWAWMQYDYTSEETIYTQDGQGVNIIGDENHVAEQTSAPQDADPEEWQLAGDEAQEVIS